MVNIQEKIIYMDGKPTNYTVTNTGIVYSLNYNKTGKKHELSQTIDTDGYYHVTMHVDGKQIFPLVSRLVAIAFIPIDEKYIENGYTINTLQVNHINGKHKEDNSTTNLEWATPSENIIHAYKTNLANGKKGKDSPVSKYDENKVHQICKCIESNLYTFKEIAKICNVRKNID